MRALLLAACAADPAASKGDSREGFGGDATGTLADTDDTSPHTGAPEKPPPLRVYLLAGQSNMDGYAYATGLPPSLQVTQDDVLLYWSGHGAWSGLGPASFGIYYGVEFFGPEVTFGRTLADRDPSQPIALVKHAVGGTDLAAYWYPGKTRDDAAQGEGYRTFLSTVDAALADLEVSGVDYEIAGMLWMQGESDALVPAYAEAYETNLTSFVARVREDMAAPDLPFVVGEIHCPTCAYGDTVRAAEEAVAAAIPGVTAFVTQDLPINADGIHYDGSGMRTLGERFAEALLEEPYSPTAAPAFVLSGTWLSNYTGNFFLGYAFHVDRPITVTDLGTLDVGLTGIVYASQVALYSVDGSLLVRSTVPPAYTAPTSPWSAWRFVAIEPFDLAPGDYVIASQVYDGAEDRYIHDAETTAAEGVTWIEGRHAVGSVVAFPTNVYSGSTSWWGPNLLFVER